MPEVNRVIVNFGVLELTEEMRQCASFSLYAQVERADFNRSQNFKYPRPKSFYGYAIGLERGYVLWTKEISFENEELFFWRNEELLTLQAIECAVNGFQPPIQGIANAVGAIYLPSPPSEVTVKLMPTTDIVFKLFGKTTLYLRAVHRNPPPLCNGEYTWQEREQPVSGVLIRRDPLNPPNIPLNPADPNGYDLPDPPYDGENDEGDTYTPEQPDCQGCTVTITHERPGEPRFPGGPPAVNPNAVISYGPDDCPVSVETSPDTGGASFEVDANYTVRNKNGDVLFQATSYVFNPFTVVVDNGECL